MLEAVTPLPRPETTPPVTSTYFIWPGMPRHETAQNSCEWMMESGVSLGMQAIQGSSQPQPAAAHRRLCRRPCAHAMHL